MIKVKKDKSYTIVDKMYRKMRKHYTSGRKFLAMVYYRLIYILFNCVIPPSVEMGEGTSIAHGVGIVFHYKTAIGKNCIVYQNVTIGGRGTGGAAKIGDNVLIGANACILGNIVIGDNVKIGAGTVVITDIPSNSTVVGNPARIITKEETK
ncbi:MAG: serine acetyltransferase [Clostridia bacterium]|nr:serine acetyltransferase [Clostridia bacterium]